MAKGIIVSEYGAGLYRVKMSYINTITNNNRLRLQAKLDYVTQQISETPPDGTNWDEIFFMRMEKISLAKKIETLNDLVVTEDFEEDVWCVDLTEGMVGQIPVLEIGTDKTLGLQLPPGYDQRHHYVEEEHGSFYSFYSLPVADAMANLLAMPAIQKWRPTYRVGTVGSIDYGSNTCSVLLDNVLSKVQGLNINQSGTLTNVVVEYMLCDAAAFEDGDKVVVQFVDNDWGQPKVIGFESNPQPCEGWTEPWNGPLYNSKWDWKYNGEILTKNFTMHRYYDHEYGLITTSDGIGTLTSNELLVPDQPPGGLVLQYSNFWQYIPSGELVQPKANFMTFDAFGEVECYTGYYTEDYRFAARGRTQDGTQYIFVLYIVRTSISPFTHGCIGYDSEDSGWVQYGTSNGYHRTIPSDYSNAIAFPVNDLDVDAVEVAIVRDRTIAGPYSTPKDIYQGSFTMKHLALIS